MPDTIEPERYVEERVAQYRGWYDQRARVCKRWHLRLRVLGLLAAAAAPVLVNLPGTAARVAATVAGLAVLVTLGLEALLRLREQWKTYRATEQFLDKERFLYGARAGPYRDLSAEHAFLRFVERVEWVIAAENSTTLSAPPLAPEMRANGGSS